MRKHETIKTGSIDAAAFIRLHGHDIKVIKKGHRFSDFSFQKTPETERLLAAYMKGRAQVEIQAFMYSRMILKREQSMLDVVGVKKLPVTILNRTTLPLDTPGRPYWFVEGGKVYSAVFGTKRPEHANRVTEGRAFATKFEADEYITSLAAAAV